MGNLNELIPFGITDQNTQISGATTELYKVLLERLGQIMTSSLKTDKLEAIYRRTIDFGRQQMDASLQNLALEHAKSLNPLADQS